MKNISITILILCFAVVALYSQQNDRMVRIEGGTFIMGSPANEEGRNAEYEAQRQVTVGSFYMSKYEVTQKEYRELIGKYPSKLKGDDLPVNKVSWFDAVIYCNKLSEREGLTLVYNITGSGGGRQVYWNREANGYRLPFEAEWEYACRAGTTTAFYTGNTITTDQRNFPGGDGKKIKPVGSFPPNPWGVYEMHGNVAELCWDELGRDETNTLIRERVASGQQSAYWGRAPKVVRGGRSALKFYQGLGVKTPYIGFRVARNAE